MTVRRYRNPMNSLDGQVRKNRLSLSSFDKDPRKGNAGVTFGNRTGSKRGWCSH